MLESLIARLRQGSRTLAFPDAPPSLPERFRGLPRIQSAACPPQCSLCAEACPTEAIRIDAAGPRLDMGRCLFCTDCLQACPTDALRFTDDYRLATRSREALSVGPEVPELAAALNREMLALFGRSLKLRQVSAGGCGGCEADLNVLSTVVFDMGRFGVQFVASPRHADGLVITGAVSENMREALLRTRDALPEPRLVIAVGACAISGGPFAGHPEVHDGASELLPIDLYIPGCPPHPITILDGLLRLLGRIQSGERPAAGPIAPLGLEAVAKAPASV